MAPDRSMDILLELDGLVLVIDPETRHWVRFVVTRTPASREKPHGLDYTLTLHGPEGERLVGYDNAHAVSSGSGPGKKRGATHDHKHIRRRIEPYDYQDAATLLADFWTDVWAVLKERGIER
jgi:hypothetical protein